MSDPQNSKILIANLGSTSFKFRLFEMNGERELARGLVERIGSGNCPCQIELGDHRSESVAAVTDHADALRYCFAQLSDPDHGCLKSAADVAAIGFKAVHGGRYSGVQRVTDDVLVAMEEMNQAAPAHNPPYILAMRILAEQFPDLPLVAAFETGFHQTIPQRLKQYAIPRVWANDFNVQRWGFHGASHRFIAQRTAEILKRDDLRIVSCHLGGSSSLCAIRNGQSVATTMGMSPQSGLPQNNRVGDFDPYALGLLVKSTGRSLDQILDDLSNRSGLLGLSGISGDLRDVMAAASDGNEQAQLAVDVFVTEIRRHLGGMLVELAGIDVLVFTGGIGENQPMIRQSICENLESFGIQLDANKNQSVTPETPLQSTTSKTHVMVVPTNEEIIVARQTLELIRG